MQKKILPPGRGRGLLVRSSRPSNACRVDLSELHPGDLFWIRPQKSGARQCMLVRILDGREALILVPADERSTDGFPVASQDGTDVLVSMRRLNLSAECRTQRHSHWPAPARNSVFSVGPNGIVFSDLKARTPSQYQYMEDVPVLMFRGETRQEEVSEESEAEEGSSSLLPGLRPGKAEHAPFLPAAFRPLPRVDRSVPLPLPESSLPGAAPGLALAPKESRSPLPERGQEGSARVEVADAVLTQIASLFERQAERAADQSAAIHQTLALLADRVESVELRTEPQSPAVPASRVVERSGNEAALRARFAELGEAAKPTERSGGSKPRKKRSATVPSKLLADASRGGGGSLWEEERTPRRSRKESLFLPSSDGSGSSDDLSVGSATRVLPMTPNDAKRARARTSPSGPHADTMAIVSALGLLSKSLAGPARKRGKRRRRRTVAVGGLVFSSESERSGSSDDASEDEASQLWDVGSKAFSGTKAMRNYDKLRRLAPSSGLERWKEIQAKAVTRVARDPGSLYAGGALGAYLAGFCDLKRFPLGMWWAHSLLDLEPVLRKLSSLARQPAAEADRKVRKEEVRVLTDSAYHVLSGSITFLDQMAFDDGKMTFAERVSLLDPPIPRPSPELPKVRVAQEDLAKSASPLVPIELVEISGSAVREELQVLAAKVAIQGAPKAKAKAKPAA